MSDINPSKERGDNQKSRRNKSSSFGVKKTGAWFLYAAALVPQAEAAPSSHNLMTREDSIARNPHPDWDPSTINPIESHDRQHSPRYIDIVVPDTSASQP